MRLSVWNINLRLSRASVAGTRGVPFADLEREYPQRILTQRLRKRHRRPARSPADYADRLDSDVQLAPRRSPASITLEDILTSGSQSSQDILGDANESATSYGVAIARADVKDLVFPGNLQEIMNILISAHAALTRTPGRSHRFQGHDPVGTKTVQSHFF
jgi:regulator of protease activity HflC (stomatin/prohibitin superfamily)